MRCTLRSSISFSHVAKVSAIPVLLGNASFLEVTDACIVAITTVICCAERAEESVI